MFGIGVVLMILVTVGVKWLTMAQLRQLAETLAGAQTSFRQAKDRLQSTLSGKADAERKVLVLERNNQVVERRIMQLEKDLGELNARAKERADLERRKFELTEQLRKKP